MATGFSGESEKVLSGVAQKYTLSETAVVELCHALLRNGCNMAQFNIYELGGSGQWMRGGMTMVGDMFNYSLKAKVDGLCNELSNLIGQGLIQYIPVAVAENTANGQNSMGGFTSFGNINWWGDLGQPNSTGSQNEMSYAIFNQTRRLAILVNGKVTVFDTLDHQIGGVGQQQGGSYSVSFTSQKGYVNLNSLPIVSKEVGSVAAPLVESVETKPELIVLTNTETTIPNIATEENPKTPEIANPLVTTEEDIFLKIEKLASLKDKGILTEEEFTSKKTELLSRI